MLWSCTKKQSVIGNSSFPMTNSKKNLDKIFFTWDLKIIKYITWNIKLSKDKKEVLALFNFGNKTNLIF